MTNPEPPTEADTIDPNWSTSEHRCKKVYKEGTAKYRCWLFLGHPGEHLSGGIWWKDD